MMHHDMSLRPGPFSKIADGSKRYELRLHDEKRRLIRIGDTITFTCTADERRVHVRVTELLPFDSFAALYDAMPMAACGYAQGQAADPRDMEAYYPPEKQAQYGVLAIGVECIRLPITSLTGEFAVRALSQADVPAMLQMAQGNPLYYAHMRMQPTSDNLTETLTALPPRRTLADKHFFGWFEGNQLIAMMDLIWRHPSEDMAFIGWFMVDAARQGRGLGRRLVADVLAMLKNASVTEVRLGCIDGNPQSERFWHACGFVENGLGYDTAAYHVTVMSRKL